jgi:hypothetical protein
LYNASKAAGSKGIFTFPHQTWSSVILSLTINRSKGDRPVYSPVLIANAPVEVSIPGLTQSCHVIRWLIIDNESLRFRFHVFQRNRLRKRCVIIHKIMYVVKLFGQPKVEPVANK